MKKTTVILTILVIGAILLCGCKRSDIAAADYIGAVMKKYEKIPAGRFYDAENFSKFMAHSLYGSENSDEGYPEEFGLIDDFCVWLCSDSEAPCEFAVFRTRAASDTTVIAKMIFRRLDRLKKFWRETPYSGSVDEATVSVEGHYVIFELYGQKNSVTT